MEDFADHPLQLCQGRIKQGHPGIPTSIYGCDRQWIISEKHKGLFTSYATKWTHIKMHIRNLREEGRNEGTSQPAYYFGKPYFTLLFCRIRLWYNEFGWSDTRRELRHAWTVIPPLPLLVHEGLCNQTCKDSDLSIPLPSPAEMALMNWKFYIRFHGNRHH